MTGRQKDPAPTPQAPGAVDSWRRSNTPPRKTTDPAGPITEAAASGDRLKLLVALRDHVAEVIDGGCAPRDLVGLSRRLIDLAAEVRQVQAAGTQLRAVSVDGVFDPEAV